MGVWKISDAMREKRKASFKRGVIAGHGRRREVTEKNLASRNAYRRAIGLPEVTTSK